MEIMTDQTSVDQIVLALAIRRANEVTVYRINKWIRLRSFGGY